MQDEAVKGRLGINLSQSGKQLIQVLKQERVCSVLKNWKKRQGDGSRGEVPQMVSKGKNSMMFCCRCHARPVQTAFPEKS